MVPVSVPERSESKFRTGVLLVIGSAVVWSFGGAIARFIETQEVWAVVFWRSFFATAFLFSFLVWRDGLRGAVRLIADVSRAGLAVSLCFTVASISFVVALQYTSVANILVVQAGVPLLAALISRVVFKEYISGLTWLAAGAVIFGVAVMVSESLGGGVSAIGNGLACLIAVVFASATVITRRNADVRMTPAVFVGTALAGLIAYVMANSFVVVLSDLGWLFAFGALNLGLGLALFTSGARFIPAPVAALLSVLEPVLGPIWVWLVHNEVPSSRTMLGGSIVCLSLIAYLAIDWQKSRV